MARNLANKAVKPLGLEFVQTNVSLRSNKGRRAGFGSTTILGSFPPKDAPFLIGPPETYFIHQGYRVRSDPNYFDDFADPEGCADCQLEVHQFAKEICDRDQPHTICDVGCGSAVKLMRYFSGMTTIGVDLPQTCDRLRNEWPAGLWLDSFERLPPCSVDLLIASDIIE